MSPADLAIHAENVGKRYVKYDDTPTLIGGLMALRRRTRRSKLWAVRHVNFDVERGDCIGIIGRNGSGKSTLLKMLAGVTSPTEGTVTVNGQVAPLIAVGVGFHPELTGRDNVYLSATILGLSKREVDERFDEILDFSEIGDFIDTPVKFYSSGLFVRLGFAVSVFANPDVLLVDEVLAVGDLAFQMKCFDRMAQIREAGTTVVVVSHNLNAVRQTCERTAVMHQSELVMFGPTADAISRLHELLDEPRELDSAPAPSDYGEVTGAAKVERLVITDRDGGAKSYVHGGEDVEFEADVSFRDAVESPLVAFRLFNESGTLVYSEMMPQDTTYQPGTSVRFRLQRNARVPTGSYAAELLLAAPDGTIYAAPTQRASFYVGGRPRVKGTNDLGATLASQEVRP